MLPDELTTGTYRAKNGEYGWRRDQVPAVAALLRKRLHAILGGELWWVLHADDAWSGSIPQREGPDAVYHWEIARRPGESWESFVDRCTANAVEASKVLPGDEVPADLPGQVLYNLTWVSETEYETLGDRSG
jgi:hypothetical protein